MIVALFFSSIIMMPMTVFAEEDDNNDDDDEDKEGIYKDYRGGFGASFDEYGYGGEMIGNLFQMLLLDGVDLEDHEMGEGVYTLSASIEEEHDGEWDFAEEEDTEEIHMLPWFDEDEDDSNDYSWNYDDGYPYCKITKTGGFDYNLTVGASLTLLVWDYDKSFIEAAQKVLDVLEKVAEEEEDGEISDETAADGIEVITWLLIHINEIFTGDELFVFNPITYQTLEINPWDDYSISKEWYNTGTDFSIDDDDTFISGAILGSWNDTAKFNQDSYMQWLLRNMTDNEIMETIWTQFSFDLAQLWVKEFYVEVDLAEVANQDWDNIIEEVDIEFFMFTHHLGGIFLYNDLDDSGTISVDYVDADHEQLGDIEVDNEIPQVPDTTEVTHQVILGDMEEFEFLEPEIDDDDDSIEWGLKLNNPKIAPVPVGVDLDSYLGTTQENLDYIEFKLNFEHEIDGPDKDGEYEGYGEVKLEHNLAPWDGKNEDPYTNITDLDLAIVYVSTVLHFQLEAKREEVDPEDEDYFEESDFEEKDDSLKVGNYKTGDVDDLIDFVDIAGEDYLIGNDKGSASDYEPTTSIIPIALWTGEYKARETDKNEDDEDTEKFTATDIEAEAEWNIMLYAICYPEFNGNRQGIWHDPTFSVYLVFTPESTGFWGLILLIAGVGLAGVAAILIKRRKDKKL
ncbi:MAG: hypothetical protein ACFFAN_05000 [Promethearchaeota archaeon]